MMTDTSQKKSIEWAYSHKEKLIQLIQELVQIPSISGKELDIQTFLFKKLNELGFETKKVYPDLSVLKNNDDFFETTSFTKYGYEKRPNISGVLKGIGNGPSLCLSGHVDVVSPEPLDQWTKNPWKGEIDGEWIYGRGAGDMKGGLAAMIFACESLKETNVKLQGNVYIETTIEEEDGGVGGALYMRITEPKYDAAIIPEPLNHAIGIASAGVMYFRVKVIGSPAHASTAHYGVNAIQKMYLIINALEKLHQRRQHTIHYKYAEIDETMKGKATTINIGTIQAGDWPSTVPGSCTIECRVGWPPGETREQIRKQIEDTIQSESRKDPWLQDHLPLIEWFGWNAQPHELSPNHPFVQLVKNEATMSIGKELPYIGGAAGLDARYFVTNGIPAVTFGPIAERIHSYDERVNINSTLKVAETLISVIQKFCKIK